MKTKILSLALALMMIISVAAAMPVSADTVEDIIFGAKDVTLDNAGSPLDTTTVPSADYGWVPNGYIYTSSAAKTTITATVNVITSGYYDFYIAAQRNASTTAQKLTSGFYCDDVWMFNFAPGLSDTSTTVETKAGVVYLEAGERTIKLAQSVNYSYTFHGFKLAYAGTEAPETIISTSTGYATLSKAGGGPYTNTVPTDTFGWIQNGSVLFAAAQPTVGTYDVNIYKAGLYQLTLAARIGTSAVKLKVAFGDGAAKTVTIPAAAASSTTVQAAMSSYVFLTAGKNTITVTASTGNPYYHGLKLDYIDSHIITANATAGGTATSAAAVVGGSATITATPDDGYKFDGWYNASGAKVSDAASYTIENLQADATYTAKFELGALIELEDYVAVGTKGDVDGASGGKLAYTGWSGLSTDASFSVPVTIEQSGYYDIDYVVNKSSTYGSLITLSLDEEEIGKNNSTGVAMAYNANSTLKSYLPLTKYRVTHYIEQGDYTLNFAFGLAKADGTSATAAVYKFQLDYVEFSYIDGIKINAKDMTKLKGSNYYTSGSATTNNSDWAISSGLSFCGMSGGVGLEQVINVSETGWYSIEAAYGTPEEDAELMVYLDNSSQAWHSVVPTTGSNATVGEIALGYVYLVTGTDYTFTSYVRSAQAKTPNGWGMNLYSFNIERTDDRPTEVIINGALPTAGSYIEKELLSYAPSDNSVSWAYRGSLRIQGSGDWAEYKIYVPTAGYYTVNVASGAFAGNTPLVGLVVNGTTEVTATYLNTPLSDLSNNLLDVSETVIDRVYLNEGENTIQINGVSQSTHQRIFNIKLEREDLPASYDVRITDAGDNELSTVTGGSRIFAEVALPEDVTGAEIFLAQYAGSGDDKTLVKTSRIGEANVAIYSANGLNFYRTKLTTDAVAGSVKAFLWTADGEYIPLAAFDVATVQ